jgi:hypothetical protein
MYHPRFFRLLINKRKLHFVRRVICILAYILKLTTEGLKMKIRILGMVSLVCLGLFFAGCATIVAGTSQSVSINSNVKGADVIVNGKTVGKTPYNGPIERGDSTTVTLQKDGYDPKTIILSTEIETIFWGNIIVGGVLGSTVDLATGGMYKYAPATLQIDLDKAQAEQTGN